MRLLAFSFFVAAMTFESAVFAQSAFPPGENIVMPLPSGYSEGFRNSQNRNLMIEYVPRGQSVQNWRELLTLQVFRDLGGRNPRRFLEAVARSAGNRCPGFESNIIREQREQGLRIALMIGICPAGNGETFIAKAISGQDALYVVQGAFRGPIKDELVVKWSSYLRDVSVCDTRSRQRPCP